MTKPPLDISYLPIISRASPLEEILDNVNTRIARNNLDYPPKKVFLENVRVNFPWMLNYAYSLDHMGFLKYDDDLKSFYITQIDVTNKERMDYLVDKVKKRIENGNDYFMFRQIFPEEIVQLMNPTYNRLLLSLVDIGAIEKYSRVTYSVEDKDFFFWNPPSSNKELLNISPEEVDRFLVREGFIISDVRKVRDIGNITERLYAAPDAFNGFSIDHLKLAMVLFGEEWNKNSISRLNHILKREFGDSHELPYMHQYRKKVRRYKGNYYSNGEGLEIGRNDLKNNIRIPEIKNDKRIMQYVGMVLGDGNLVTGKRGVLERLTFSGRKDDKLFYHNVLQPRVAALHNHNYVVHISNGYPSININSKYVCDWASKRVFPNIEQFVDNKHFLEGIVATMADINLSDKVYMRFSDSKEWLVDLIYDSLSGMGYSPSKNIIVKKGSKDYTENMVRIYKSDTLDLMNDLHLLNPKHKFALKDYLQSHQ